MGILQPPWKRVKKHEEKETVFVMVRRNYKVSANIGFSKHTTRRFAKIIDIGLGPSFVRKDILPQTVWININTSNNGVRIPDANNRYVPFDGTIDLVVNIVGRGSMEIVSFNVVEILLTQVILGCIYCDKHFETIRYRQSIVELADETTVHIIRKPAPRPKDRDPLPEKQE